MRSIKASWSAGSATGRRLALQSFFPPMSSRMQSGCANALPSSRVEKSDSKEKFRKRATAYVRRCGLKPARPKVRGALHCLRSEEHTSELQSLMRISYAVFCLKKKKKTHITEHYRVIPQEN